MGNTTENLARDRIREIHCEIGHLRASIANKVCLVSEILGQEVAEMRDGVTTSVESVKQSLSIRHHVRQHPWLMVQGATIFGCIIGRKIFSRHPAATAVAAFAHHAPLTNGTNTQRVRDLGAPVSGWEKIRNQFHSELPTLRGLALGALAGVARDLAVRAVPDSFSAELREVADRMGSALGVTVPQWDRAQRSSSEARGGTGDSPKAESVRSTSARTP